MGEVSSNASAKALIKEVSYDPIKDFVAIAKFGLYPFPYLVPSATPDDIVGRWRSEVRKALADPVIVARLAAVGFEVSQEDPQEFPQKLKADVEGWKRQAQAAGIEPQ